MFKSSSIFIPTWFPTRNEGPGIVLATALGVVSVGLARALPPSPLVSDVLIGMLFGGLVLNTPLRKIVGLRAERATGEASDRYASGLRFTGKWILRFAIILMGLKVETRLFGSRELLVIGGVAGASVPSAFFVAHALASALGVRRAMGDLLAAGTMICGASAVNAAAPVCGAQRDEQGVAVGVIFLFSVVAMLTFHPIADWLGLDSIHAGLWSGLAVNDLSSAVAVGAQMGGSGSVMAAASKSARILLLAPMLFVLAFLRRAKAEKDAAARASMTKNIVDAMPSFILGYVALAIARSVGDRIFGDAPGWAAMLAANKLLLDVLMTSVSAAIGLHLPVGPILATSGRAAIVAGGTSAFMAAVTLAMLRYVQDGAVSTSVAIGLAALAITFLWYRYASTNSNDGDTRGAARRREPSTRRS